MEPLLLGPNTPVFLHRILPRLSHCTCNRYYRKIYFCLIISRFRGACIGFYFIFCVLLLFYQNKTDILVTLLKKMKFCQQTEIFQWFTLEMIQMTWAEGGLTKDLKLVQGKVLRHFISTPSRVNMITLQAWGYSCPGHRVERGQGSWSHT